MAEKLKDPRHPELDITDLGREYLRLIREADEDKVFDSELEALPMHDDEDPTYIAAFPRRSPEDIENNVLPAQYIAFIPVRVDERVKAVIGIGRDKFHVVAKGMLMQVDGEAVNQAGYMVPIKGIPETARELWHQSLQTPFTK